MSYKDGIDLKKSDDMNRRIDRLINSNWQIRSKMYVQSVSNSDTKVKIMGVRHNSIRDTRYVVSELKRESYDIAFVEKHPKTNLENCVEQTRKIVGHIIELDIKRIDFDLGYSDSFPYEKIDDTLQDIDVKERKRSDILDDVRDKIRRQSESMYQEGLEYREKEMIKCVNDRLPLDDNSEVVVIVGEIHVDPLLQKINIDKTDN